MDSFDDVQRLVFLTSQVLYRNVSVGKALKIRHFDWCMLVSKRRGSLRDVLALSRLTARLIISVLKRILIGVSSGILGAGLKGYQRSEAPDRDVLVICDHSGHIEEMTLALLQDFDPDRIVLITINNHVYRRMVNRVRRCYDAYGEVQRVDLRNARKYWSCYRAIRQSVGSIGLVHSLYLFFSVCSIVQSVDFFYWLFSRLKFSALVTMNDSQWNEYVATVVAKTFGIMTYTNQHGELGYLPAYLPVVSDRIFVWGEAHRDIFVNNGTPEEQVVVSGNPKFDIVYSWYRSNAPRIKQAFVSRHEMAANQLVVTYLASEIIDATIARELLSVFCGACNDLEVNVVIKLRPQVLSQRRQYQRWLKEFGLRQKCVMLEYEGLFDVLSATDIAVTYTSSAGLEAIGFGVPVMVMNMIPDVDIGDCVPFIRASIECKSRKEFRVAIRSLVEESARLDAARNAVTAERSRYFANSTGNSASRFVSSYLDSIG